MDVVVAVGVLVVAAVIVVVALTKQQPAEQPDVETDDVARKERREREMALAARIDATKSIAGVRALCKHQPPLSLQFLKSEQVVWVVPECTYLKTTKVSTYAGQSAGLSVQVVKGVSVRTGGSRGRRVENEFWDEVDFGTVVLTTKHIYFQGEDKERFRVRLDKLVSAEMKEDGFLFQRDAARARPEAFESYDVRMIAPVLAWLQDPEYGGSGAKADPDDARYDFVDGMGMSEAGDGPDDFLDGLGASESD